MGMREFLHSTKNAITGRVDETTVYVRLLRSGNWVGPLDFNVIALAYGMMKDLNGGADLLNAAKKGDEVEVKMPIKIANYREYYTVCCLVDSVDAFVFAGVKRTIGNKRDTVYTMGRKDKKYYANPWFKIPSEHGRFNQCYRQILDTIYGIHSDAGDFYDQVVLAQEEHTGQKFLRDPDLGDGDDWHGNIQADPNAGLKLNALIDFNRIDHNGDHTFSNFASWYFEEKGRYKIENCFMLNLEELKAYIDTFYRQSNAVVKEDVDRATMSFANLFAKIAMDVTTSCFARVTNRSESEVELQDSVCALLVSLGLFDKKAIDDAIKDLFTKDGPKESESTSEVQREYGAGRSEKRGGDDGRKKKTGDEEGFGGTPKMDDGRQVDFDTIRHAIKSIEEDISDPEATEKHQFRCMRAVRALDKALAEAKTAGRDAIGSPYLNWVGKEANPDINELRLRNGALVYFKTKVEE